MQNVLQIFLEGRNKNRDNGDIKTEYALLQRRKNVAGIHALLRGGRRTDALV